MNLENIEKCVSAVFLVIPVNSLDDEKEKVLAVSKYLDPEEISEVMDIELSKVQEYLEQREEA